LTLLLDTHVLLWAIDGSLSAETAELIAGSAEPVLASAASIWEIEIKRAQRRLRAPVDFTHLVDETGFERLPITFEHAVAAARLPLHHRDPFDRMLIAQACAEKATLATSDQQIERYDVATLAVAPA
jgi:PIN domain nuclease of toxin-antitoxin system